jgi:hypothetical protein
MQKGQRKQTDKTTLRSERRGVRKSLQKEKKKGLDGVSIVREGWLREKKYADGMTWLFCYQTTRQADGKRVENSKRVGLVADFPTETAAWMEAGRLGLHKYMDGSICNEPTFKQIAEHWRLHELRKEGIIGRKAEETADRDEHNLDRFILPRWGECLAGSIKPTEVESWFETLASTP